MAVTTFGGGVVRFAGTGYFCRVNHLRAISLLLVYLLGATGAHELLKVPALFSHYALHLEETGERETFFGFLAEHYTHEASHDAEHADHDKLPFKTVDNCSRVNQSTLPMVMLRVQAPEAPAP